MMLYDDIRRYMIMFGIQTCEYMIDLLGCVLDSAWWNLVPGYELLVASWCLVPS